MRSYRIPNGQSAAIPSGVFASNGEIDMLKTLKSATTTSKSEFLHVATVGEILLEEFLKPMEISQNGLARAIGVPPRRINEIVLGKRAVTADTDLRLTRYFGLNEGFFLRLQMDYDLRMRKREMTEALKAIRPRAA
jgi:antitoxin HigA-1